MDSPLEQFIKVHEFSTGRRIVALRKVRDVAAQMGEMDIVAHIIKALDHERTTRMLDMAWIGRKTGRRPASELPAIDLLVDEALTGVRDGALALTKGARKGDSIIIKVEAFIGAILPDGLEAVTSLPYAEEIVALEAIVDKLQGPLAHAVVELGLSPHVDRLIERVKEYRAAHRAGDPEIVEFSEVRAARERGQCYLLEIIALIMGTYYKSDDADHQAARQVLLAPIIAQNEAIRAYLRARRRVQDIDPDTGDIDAEPVADDADLADAAVVQPMAEASTVSGSFSPPA